jgi:hypothetical protein
MNSINKNKMLVLTVEFVVLGETLWLPEFIIFLDKYTSIYFA